MTKINWNTENINKLKDLVSNGLTTPQISEKMGISEQSISSKLCRLKIVPNRSRGWTNNDINKLKELIANGKNCKEMQTILNKTHHAIQSKKSKLGLITQKRWTEEEINYYIQQRCSGASCADIAKVLNKSISTVRNLQTHKKINILFPYRKWTNFSIYKLRLSGFTRAGAGRRNPIN